MALGADIRFESTGLAIFAAGRDVSAWFHVGLSGIQPISDSDFKFPNALYKGFPPGLVSAGAAEVYGVKIRCFYPFSVSQ